MSNFTPKDIKKLREITSAGMMDCKKALQNSDGNIDKAISFLREKGLGAAAKKSGKITTEGVISMNISSNKATLIEINSQTDFVAQNETFKSIISEITYHSSNNNLDSVDDLHNSIIDGDTFSNYLSLKISTIGENIVIRRINAINSNDETFAINGYIHANNKVGVILGAKTESKEIALKMVSELKNIAMHAAAMSPKTLNYKEFDLDFINSEQAGRIKKIEKENKELARVKKPLKNIPKYISQLQLTDEIIDLETKIIKEELKKNGKPEKIWHNIIPGKIQRFISDNTSLDQELALLSQKYVMKDTLTIEEYINEFSQGKAKITHFTRFEVGEGMEIVEEDFAAEVAKQMN